MRDDNSLLSSRLATLPFGVTWLSSADARHASRLLKLAEGESFEFPISCKDIFVVAGSVSVDDSEYEADSYFGQNDVARITALSEALLFVFSSFHRDANMHAVKPGDSHRFFDGRNPGVQRCDLRTAPYAVALIEFAAGTCVAPHRHQKGEEIYVLSGELLNAPDRLGVGDWRRLSPSEIHSPRADVPTRFLLLTNNLMDETPVA